VNDCKQATGIFFLYNLTVESCHSIRLVPSAVVCVAS